MNVVVLDDEPAVVELLQEYLTELPQSTPVGFTATEPALEWCRRNDCDLALVDRHMPPPDGREFVRRFRELEGCEDVPVLFISGDASRETRYEALELGAVDLITKPFDARELLLRARNLLASRHRRSRLAGNAAELMEEVNRVSSELVTREQELILRLSRAAEFREQETAGHLIRVGMYSKLIARNLGLSDRAQDMVLRAAQMHDIGKVGIPDHILLKPSRLTEEEWAIMMDHTLIGKKILGGSTSALLQAAAEIALSHHEKWDGSGYPQGLSGEQIPIFARIVAVADVFDALVSDRPQRPAWEPERARELLIRQSGSHFDPHCVEAFHKSWDEVLLIRDRVPDRVN